MIASDFPSISPDFFLRKNPVEQGKNPVSPGKNPVKIPDFSVGIQLRTGILAYSYARIYVGTRTSPRPPPARPGFSPHPCPARHPGPVRHPGPAVRHLRTNFSWDQNRFFFGTYRIFPSSEETMGKIGTNGENPLTALKQPCPPRSTAQNVVPRHLLGLQPSACTQCCISQGNCLKSQC